VLSTTLHHASVGTEPSAAEVDAYLSSLAEASTRVPELVVPKPEAQDVAAGRGLGCVRGLCYALAAEVAAALLFYGAWRMVHLLIH
jgi:hypothetical protein